MKRRGEQRGRHGVWVKDASGMVNPSAWDTKAQADCSSGTGTCSVTSAVSLVNGNATWRVRPSNAMGASGWSGIGWFTVAVL